MRQLVPAAEQLSPTLIAFAKLAPEAKGFFEGLATGDRPRPDRLPGPAQALPRRLPAAAARASTRSCATSTRSSPASTSTSTRSPSFFGQRRRGHQRRIHRSKTTRANSSTTCARWARSTRNRSRPIRNRLTTNRNSAYSPPLWAKGLASGLPSFDTRQCSSGHHRDPQPEHARTNPPSRNATERKPATPKKPKTSSNA